LEDGQEVADRAKTAGFFRDIGIFVAASTLWRSQFPGQKIALPKGELKMIDHILPFTAKSFLAFSVLFLAPGYAAQADESGRHFDIVATDGSFEPAVLNVQPGERVHVTVYNQGRNNHSIRFILPQGYIGIRAIIAPWRSASFAFKAPRMTGQYTFYCPIFNHGALGMQGTLVVGTGQ
jgi:plastocyanin